MRIKTTLIIAAVWLITGCAHISQSNQKLLDEADAAAAKVEADQTVDDAEGTADPVEHPIKNATVVVKKGQLALGKIAIVAFVAVCVFVGLLFTAFSFVSKVGLPVAGALLAGSVLGIFTLPAVPFVAIGLGVALILLLIYELHEHGVDGLFNQLITAVTFGKVKIETPAPVKASPEAPYIPHQASV